MVEIENKMIQKENKIKEQATPLAKNECVTLTIEDIGSEGEGIGKFNGFTLFVKDSVVGDVLIVKILKTKKSYGYAKIESIVTPSKFRVIPRCELASRCGGCQLQQLNYEQQLEYKQRKVKNCIERIAGIKDFEMEPILEMEEPYFYRNKSQYPVGYNKDGDLVMGFYAGRTHTIIDANRCYIGDKSNERILEIIRSFLIKEKIRIYQEDSHTGLLRHILIRVGFTSRQIMICFVLNGTKLPKQEELVSQLLAYNQEQEDYQITSICYNVNKEKTNVILGSQVLPLFGETTIIDQIGDIKYQISPLSFYQVNPVQTKKLYEHALEYADLQGKEIVWDLYCGIGTISLFLAQRAKQVYGVEIIPQAIEDAKRNAKLNQISNAEFFVGAAEEVLPAKYIESQGAMSADVIVVDPPRKGCEQSLLETVVKMKPKRIVYVSCDPATLARDIKYLSEQGYCLKKVRAVDQFPHSVHVETVVLLTRKS
jgi:23S rRNA (uracil1939-C5)-methyltransferase